jgi:Fur family ferric uptake transcriptional regulator
VTELSPETIRPLTTVLEQQHGFETDVGHLTIFGRCAECGAAGRG